ncbi:MAG: hypothetical protein HWD59_05645 [Coxiellaceae bacterium]|nr:MAG: hypothetical protein HWD59_05645 [Coxiellaceae bacterium]
MKDTQFTIKVWPPSDHSPSTPAPAQTFQGQLTGPELRLMYLDLQHPFSIEFTDPATQQALPIVLCQGKPCPARTILLINPADYSVETSQDPDLNHLQRKTLTLKLAVIPPVVLVNARYDQPEVFEHYCQQIHVPFSSSDQNEVASVLPYFNRQDQPKDPYRRTQFTDQEIALWQQQGNNVTWLIHGYNVPYGEFGHAFDFVSPPALQDTPAYRGFKSTRQVVLRDLLHEVPEKMDIDSDAFAFADPFTAARLDSTQEKNLILTTHKSMAQEHMAGCST